MALNPEQLGLPSTQPSGYEVINSSTHPGDLRLKLALSAIGTGYVEYDRDYLIEEARLREQGEQMSKAVLGDYRDAVGKRMLKDRFANSDRATTFEVFIERELAGTSRLVEESNRRFRGLPSLELSRLVTPDVDDEWSAVISADRSKKYGEIGRVVVVKDFRDRGLTTEILQRMIDGENGVREVAMEKGIDYVLMAAHRKLTRHLEQTSMILHEPIPIKLRPAGKRVARKSPGYWDKPPQLIVAEFPKAA